ncbi:MAG: NUDIX hydrolase family protein [Bifidobacteriaceae bacterium]|nr:NUDIX hydrolase family protein [Bifidobacteriaceae bacterium]
MAVLNGEIPDSNDFDADGSNGNGSGAFDDLTPDDFIHGSGNGNPPGWMSAASIDEIRSKVPIPYVEIVPVRVDDFGRITSIATLLRVAPSTEFNRTLVAGRVLLNESLREAIARNVAKDLGDMALPLIPLNLQPFKVAEFFQSPGLSEFHDARQHAIALCYIVPVAGDCKPQDDALDLEWVTPTKMDEAFFATFADGHGLIVKDALAYTR